MIVYITKDRFWMERSSIERWPEILAKLPERMNCSSKYALAEKYLNYQTDEQGRIVRADEVYGLFGAEWKNGKLIISGCNFIKKGSEGYCLSREAVDMVRAYQEDNGWEKILARQLLKYSVRVRGLMIGILNGEGIFFKKKFLADSRKAYVEVDNVKYYIFNPGKEAKNLNDFMQTFSRECLGGYWKKELEIDDNENIEFEGMFNKAPSTSHIGTFLKMPLTLFEFLGWFAEREPGRFVLDTEKMAEHVGVDVVESLKLDGFKSDLDILRLLIKEHGDSRGYFPVAIVGKLLKERVDPLSEENLDRWIDRYFIKGITEGKFKLAGTEQGQPKHGRGLLGDKEKQLIKLVF